MYRYNLRSKALTTPATPRKRTTVAKGYTKKHHYGSLDGEVGYVDDEVRAMYKHRLTVHRSNVQYNTELQHIKVFWWENNIEPSMTNMTNNLEPSDDSITSQHYIKAAEDLNIIIKVTGMYSS